MGKYQTRIQYDSIDRYQIARRLSDAAVSQDQQKAVSYQAVSGLIILTFVAYVVCLAIGGAKATPVITDTPVELRNLTVAEALLAHPTDSLVGEFWRILPANHQSGDRAALVPLASCTSPAPPASTAFQQRSFAYLRSMESTDSKFADCTTDQLITAYGRPSAITITDGTVEQPLEEVFFYDQGSLGQMRPTSHPTEPSPQNPSTNGLVELRHLNNTTCSGKRTIMQVVAHEDDDLLFMNPDLLHAIQQGDCVRTIYLTAGDAGSSKFYWLGRERGSEAAYALLGGIADEWTTQTVKFGNHRFGTVATPVHSDRLSVAFMHLPDGKPDGQGFKVQASRAWLS